MSTYDSVVKTGKNLMFQEPFYGLFLLQLNKKLTDRVPAAAVTKRGINFDLLINETFWNTRTENQKIGLLKHELLHIVFFHLLDFDRAQDKVLMNIATDLEVNQYIKPEFYPCEGIVLLSSYPELNLPTKAGWRKYYELLQQAIQQGTCPQLTKDHADFGNEHGNQQHTTWAEFTEGMSEAEKKLIQKQIDYQLKETADILSKSRGTVPSELEHYINGLSEVIPPVVDWKSYIRRFSGNSNKIYTKKTRKKPNKRFPGNPALKIKTKKHIAVGIDTSGSVLDTDLVEFFNEIHHIHKTGSKVSIIECDAYVHRVYEYKGKTMDQVTGRGGTDFQPVIDYVNMHYKEFTSLIYLTDMECSPPTSCRKPTLWVGCSSASEDAGKGFHGNYIKIQR